ncbi:DUF305 domain-containing protein [Gemmatimonas aurantiaca]|uniref:DUF305 domain-containing protein n=1 Tax=Gemmatimonas aurantiaca TaxID=173480 RepID=UPI00301BE2BC
MILRRCLLAAFVGIAPLACATAPARAPSATGGQVAAQTTAPDMASHAGHTMTAPAPAASADAHAGHAMAGHDMAGGHKMDLGNIPAPTIPAGALITVADVRFMQGMIGHHAQAVEMTRIARANGSDPYVLKLAQKIDLSQIGEIVLMQDWLRAHKQFAPDTSSWRTMSMMGLLTADEMKQLEATKGAAFDKLFLTLMIRHHEGAIMMVHELFGTPRAGQEVDVSVLANDIETTQSAEIALMRQLLLDL